VLDILAAVDAEGDAAAEPEADEEADDEDEPAETTRLVLCAGSDERMACRARAHHRTLSRNERLSCGSSGNRHSNSHRLHGNSNGLARIGLTHGSRSTGIGRISGIGLSYGSRGTSISRVSRIRLSYGSRSTSISRIRHLD